MNLKAIIRDNPLYQQFVRPMRVKLNTFIESRLDDESYFLRRHRKIFGYTPDFKHPKTFNEKIIHRILYDRNPIYTALADKLKARIYITYKLSDFVIPELKKQGEIPYKFLDDVPNILDSASPLFAPIDSLYDTLMETNICPFLPKLYGIWKNTSEIDFDSLPESFVLKTNHDGGGVVLVPDKQEFLADSKAFQEAMNKLTKHLETNFYTLYREWHYKDIEPRIFAEELLGEALTTTPSAQKFENDGFHKFKVPENYRVFTFYNSPIFIQVDDAHYAITHKRWFYNEKWQFQYFSYNFKPLNDDIARPSVLEEMISIARILCDECIVFVRVDLYEFNDKVYCGELTLTPCGGVGKFSGNWDKNLGDLWLS